MNKQTKVKILNKSINALPFYATPGASGMDLKADLQDTIIVSPMERVIVPTGLYLEIPEGYEAQIRPRSGLAAKNGITVLNTPGTIDSDYRGEIKVILINLSSDDFTIVHGDRIAQMVIAEYVKIEWVEEIELSDTQRGEGGFGSTGLKN